MQKFSNKAFIIVGIVFIVAAGLVLFYSNPDLIVANLRMDSAVDQEGFAPVFIPSADGSQPDKAGLPAEAVNYPERILIEEIGLDAPVIIADSVTVMINDTEVTQFLVPEKYAAGWHENSTPLGEVGNTVISGHHNAYGKVFENLVDLKEDSEMVLISDGVEYRYTVIRRLILPEKEQPLDVRLENGRWMMPSDDERVTLITCWPKNTNSHRLILVATPSSSDEAG